MTFVQATTDHHPQESYAVPMSLPAYTAQGLSKKKSMNVTLTGQTAYMRIRTKLMNWPLVLWAACIILQILSTVLETWEKCIYFALICFYTLPQLPATGSCQKLPGWTGILYETEMTVLTSHIPQPLKYMVTLPDSQKKANSEILYFLPQRTKVWGCLASSFFVYSTEVCCKAIFNIKEWESYQVVCFH